MRSTTHASPSIKRRFILVVILASVPFFLAVISSTVMVTALSSNRMQQQIENSTNTLHNLIDSMLRSSVRTYLLSKLEVGTDLTEKAVDSMRMYPEGEADIRQELVQSLLSLQVGKAGYFYAVDSNGTVQFHPDRTIVGSNQAYTQPVNDQIVQRSGYLEYEWQNTDEALPRKKALYMEYIPELDWILTATSYRAEFTHMIDRDSLKKTVNQVSVGRDGYAYVLERDGTVIAHPYLTGREGSALISEREYEQLVARFFDQTGGFTTYLWRDKEGAPKRKKMVNIRYLKDFDWIVGTAYYTDSLYRPMGWIVLLNAAGAFIIAGLLFLVIYRINSSIEKQIGNLSLVVRQATEGNLQVRAIESGPRELTELSRYFNQLLGSFEDQTEVLSSSLKEKEVLLREIQHRVKNNLQTILSLLNLQRSDTSSGEAAFALAKTNNRVNAMAMVYDYLFREGKDRTRDEVNMHSFLSEYIDSVILSLEADMHRMSFTKQLDDIDLSRDRAIICGLLLNELIIGSVEHTVHKGIHAEIAVRFIEEDEDVVMFSVADNRSMENAAEWDEHLNQSFERSLITMLTKQLHGTGEERAAEGYEYRIRFSRCDT